ncbi:protein YLS9-like [Cucumis melo var. makuwa]|uniref:Protein YLS9-like n=2 Tax=Cucumis melo TaxID=3656 RepID=A0A5D3C1N9_CUCMM|nr:protein YLS9-like [Cucumis melo var. makuwa]TYK05863.1 protein YLS9-like [Cucumis melo var. makuwa]
MFPTSQLLVTTMALTIVIRNPNKHSSIYYNQLIEMVLCKNQQIESQIMLSPMISEKNTTVDTSLEISGGAVSVAKELANEMVRSGSGFWLRLVLMGRVKWKL